MAYIKFEELSSANLLFLDQPYAGRLIVLHEEDRTSSQWLVSFTLDVEKQQVSVLTTNQELIRKVRQEGYAQVDQKQAGFLFSLRGSARLHTDTTKLATAKLAYEKRYQKTLKQDADRQLVEISIRSVYRLDLNKV